MFGQPSQQQSAFGQSANKPAFGGFGAPAATTQPNSLFGQQPAQTSNIGQQQPAANNSLFGGQQPASTLMFGQQPAANSNSLFGAQQPANTSMFGAQQPATTSMFGAQQPATTSMFGAQQPATTSMFGQQQPATTSMFGAQQPATNSMFGQQQQQAPQQAQTVFDLITQLKEFWNPASPTYQFKHYFYNMVHPSEVSLYTLPQNDLLAQQAVENNPDSTCMVPVLALGFEDIQRRRAEQIKTNEAHAIKIQEAEEKILELKKTHHLESTVKFEQYSKKQQELTQRVIAMMKMVHVIKHKGLSIKPEEEAIKSKLDLLLTNVNKSHFKGQVDEFLAIAENNGTRKRERVEISDDGEGLRKLFQVLKETQNGLLELQDILTRCMSDVEHLENAQPFLNARK